MPYVSPREIVAFGRKVKRFVPAKRDEGTCPERDAPKDEYGEIYCETCHAESWNMLRKSGVPRDEIEAKIVDSPATNHCTKGLDYFLCESHAVPYALVAGFAPKSLTDCEVLEWEPDADVGETAPAEPKGDCDDALAK